MKYKDQRELIGRYIKQEFAKKKTLSDAIRQEIKELALQGVPLGQIAKMYNVTRQTVYYIKYPEKYERQRERCITRRRNRYNNDADFREYIKKQAYESFERRLKLYKEGKCTTVKGE